MLPITWPIRRDTAPWYMSKGGGHSIDAKDGVFEFKLLKNKVGGESGTMFYSNPFKLLPAERVTMSYSVYFPPEYNWSVKGGKLPGICLGNAPKLCATGAQWSVKAGSFRVMFREKNAAIGYAYPCFPNNAAAIAAQPASVKAISRAKGAAGLDLWHKTGTDLQLVTGWNAISFTVVLNTPGKSDGSLSLTVNGKTKSVSEFVWRASADVKINHMLMVAFFGGSKRAADQWAQRSDMIFKFKDISFST